MLTALVASGLMRLSVCSALIRHILEVKRIVLNAIPSNITTHSLTNVRSVIALVLHAAVGATYTA
jgi:hypothetical protein